MPEEEWKVKMDAAAILAAKELETLPLEHVATVAKWWARHYGSAGHKRLGKLLLLVSTAIPQNKAVISDNGRLVFKA